MANINIIIIINIFWSICLLSSIGSKVARWKPEDGTNPEELGDTYFEGDIIINAKSRNGLKSENSHWKNGIVPYTISDDFSKLYIK